MNLYKTVEYKVGARTLRAFEQAGWTAELMPDLTYVFRLNIKKTYVQEVTSVVIRYRAPSGWRIEWMGARSDGSEFVSVVTCRDSNQDNRHVPFWSSALAALRAGVADYGDMWRRR